jgi:hypothetical protein
MPRIIKRALSRISPKTRVVALTLLAAVAVGIGVAWVVANATQSATSQEAGHAAIIPTGPPLTPYVKPPPGPLPTEIPLEEWPDCRAPRDEVPGPGLPPLPCHHEALEPPPGTIPTPNSEEQAVALTSTQDVPKGWVVYDNPMFRYTFALPADWYANMRPEGGEFAVFDANEMAFFENGEDREGGVVVSLSAGLPSVRLSEADAERLETPNAEFGGYEGAIWEDADSVGLGVARVMVFAFLKDDVVFRGRINFGEGYTEDDVATVRQILGTITPY